MKLLNNTWSIAFLLVFQAACFSKDKQSDLVAYSALRKDFQILRTTLQEVHPGLYWYTDQKEMNRYMDSTAARINQNLSSTDFFKLLLPVIAKVRCVHTSISPGEREGLNASLSNLLPFEFYCHSGMVFIRKDLVSGKYTGVQVLSIGGVPASRILQTLLTYLPADGYNETFKYHLLNKGAFREGYALYFPSRDRFDIEVLFGGKPVRFSVVGISSHRFALKPSAAIKKGMAWHLYQDSATALLEVPSFEGSKVRFAQQVDSLFSFFETQRIKRLIIDLRENGGGTSDNLSTLLSYLFHAPFLHLKKVVANTSAITYPEHITNAFPHASLGKGDDTTAQKYSIAAQYAGASTKSPSTRHLFKGSVVVLVSGATTSAASEFAALTKHLGRATIVGEETGGGYYGSTGGSYIQLKLPASKLVVRIPRVKILTAVDDKYGEQPFGRGVFADYEVLPTIDDLTAGKDVQLMKAYELLLKP